MSLSLQLIEDPDPIFSSKMNRDREPVDKTLGRRCDTPSSSMYLYNVYLQDGQSESSPGVAVGRS